MTNGDDCFGPSLLDSMMSPLSDGRSSVSKDLMMQVTANSINSNTMQTSRVQEVECR